MTQFRYLLTAALVLGISIAPMTAPEIARSETASSSNDNWNTPITGAPTDPTDAADYKSGTGADTTASGSNNWDTPITGTPTDPADASDYNASSDPSQTGTGGAGGAGGIGLPSIPNIFGGNSVGSFSGILRMLNLPSWLSSVNRLLTDPCSGTSVQYIVAPEPGWCQTPSRNSSKTVTASVNDTAGELGIPNPNQTREDLGKDIESNTDVPDFFETNPTVYSQQIGNLADRIATHQSVESVLGKNAQQTTAEALKETQSLVEESAAAANSAGKMNISQNILKLLVANSARSNAIQAAISTQLTGLRVDQQFTNLGAADISRTLDDEARLRRFNDQTASAAVLTLSSQAGLMEGAN